MKKTNKHSSARLTGYCSHRAIRATIHWVAMIMLLGGVPCSIAATLESKGLKIEFNEHDATMQVTDKEASFTWRQIPAGDPLRVEKVEVKAGSIVAKVKGKLDLTLKISLSDKGKDLEVELRADEKSPLNESILYPYPFVMDSSKGNWLLNYHEGMLLPMNSTLFEEDHSLKARFGIKKGDGIQSSGGKNETYKLMNWFGLTDFKVGYMATALTPYDARQVCRKVLQNDKEVIVMQMAWDPSLGKWNYPRSMLYRFSSTGGYVSLAKLYRSHLQEKGEWKTLRDKARDTPHMDRFIGAVDIYVWDGMRKLEKIREVRAAGVEKAIIAYDPHEPEARVEDSWAEEIHRLGFLAGRYQTWNIAYSKAEPGPHYWSVIEHVYPGAVPRDVMKNPDGSLITKNPTDGKEQRKILCPIAGLQYAKLLTPKEFEDVEYSRRVLGTGPQQGQVRFLDTAMSEEASECFDPEHPLDARRCLEYRIKLCEFFAKDFKQIVGSENISSWGVPCFHYSEGAMEMEIFKDKTMKGFRSDGGSDYIARLIAPQKAGELYKKYGLGEYYRLPLIELVYHDCIVSTWHWRGSNDREGMWDKKDLYNILYGTMPLWNLTPEKWEASKERFVQCYKNVCPWFEKVGYDEMVDHCWLTSDRTVQESRFSSGWAVIVNFDEKENFKAASGAVVPPLGFNPYRWK